VKALPSLRACGAAPPGGCAPDGEGLTGYNPRFPRGGFFGGMRSARPRGTAARMPWPYISNTCVNDSTVAKRAHAPVKRKPSPRACGARPSAGGAIQGKMALRRKARGWRERRFSRRDVLCASALQGRTYAETFLFSPHALTMTRRPTGEMAGWGQWSH